MNVRPRLETLEQRVVPNAALLAAYEATVPAQLATLAAGLPKTVAAATAMLDTLALGIGSLAPGQQQQATADLQVYYAKLLAWPDEAVALLAARIRATEAGIAALP